MQHGLHLFEDVFYFEILALDSLEPAPLGEIGRLIVTALDKFGVPLLRYDIGDLAEFIEDPCSCGQAGRRLLIHGRVNEILILADGAKIFPYQLEQLMTEHNLQSSTYQLQLTSINDGNSDKLSLLIYEPALGSSGNLSVLKDLEYSFRNFIDLADMLKDNLLEVEVKFCQMDEMIQTGKGKIRRLINLKSQKLI